MNGYHAQQNAGPGVGRYLQIAVRAARRREALRLSAAVCRHTLCVEEACKLHGLKLDDVLDYLAVCGYLKSPTCEAAGCQAMTEPAACPQTGAHVDEIA